MPVDGRGGLEDDVADEQCLLGRVRAGDERAFATLVEQHSPWMLRTARGFVSSRAVAEEVVQDAWLSVIRSVGRFEGRSSVRTWLFVVLVNAAKKRAAKERVAVPSAELTGLQFRDGELQSFPDRFFGDGHPRWAGCWTSTVSDWGHLPEARLLSADIRDHIEAAVEDLHGTLKTVFVLRDIEGWTSQEVCNAMGLTASNQRVLLHRARLKVRAALESYLASG